MKMIFNRILLNRWIAVLHDLMMVPVAWLLAYCVAGVLLIALLAALGVGLVLASRYLWRRISREPQSDSASAE